MLKVFHTADWHLGQSFCGFDRDYEHSCFLDWLLRELQTQQPDAMIVAGDIFDTINPSAVSQKRLYDFLAKVICALPKLQIVMTAGNHDSAARLEAPSPLLQSMNIHVIGTVQWKNDNEIDYEKFLIPIVDSNQKVAAIVMAVPYLRPSDVPFVPNASDAYLDGVRELYKNVTQHASELAIELNANAALVAMGHCHVSGGDESRDSERCLVIGGSEAIGLSTFDPKISYVALGHLHKSQQFEGGRIRYSGSPLPLSFAESDYRHRVLMLTFADGQSLKVDELEIPRSVPLLRVPKKGALALEEVLVLLGELELKAETPTHLHPFLEVRILETGPDPTRRKKIEQVLDGKPVRLASIKIENPKSDSDLEENESSLDPQSLKWIQPEEIFLTAYQQKYLKAPDPDVLKAFREVIQRVSQQDGSNS